MDSCVRISALTGVASMGAGIAAGFVFSLFVSALLSKDESAGAEDEAAQVEIIDRDLYESIRET